MATPRILIFVVAYNAATTLAKVLARIPAELHRMDVEVLVIDDFSTDSTFDEGLLAERAASSLKITTLRTPQNQGYGGNQKLGYSYAIEQGFDYVALLHGDGQYAPEELPRLLGPLLDRTADAVFGSRMINKRDARAGGMPLYKWVGNQVLTRFENAMLGSRLSEFHSGYRIYSVAALRRIPFARNANGFVFDSEIIIQLHLSGARIVELPIPTFYGDEICRVDGVAYAWDIFRLMLRLKFHQRNLFYDRKLDVRPVEETYDLKLGYDSSHTRAIAAVLPGARVLDIGCGSALVAREFAQTARTVVGLDQFPVTAALPPNLQCRAWDLNAIPLPVAAGDFDQVFMLDIIEHLREPERFLEELRESADGKRPELILTTANIAFIVMRLLLLLGIFNYGRVGILDRTHTRLFTVDSLRELLLQAGYEISELRGIPAPFPKALGRNWLSTFLVRSNTLLARLFPRLFSYQLFVRARPLPTLHHVFTQTIEGSAQLKLQPMESAR